MAEVVAPIHEAAGTGGPVEPVEVTYSTREVADAVGCSYREILYWLARGYTPSSVTRHKTATTGTPIRLTHSDALQIGAMHALVSAGLYPAKAAKVLLVTDYIDGPVHIRIDWNAVVQQLEKALPITAQ